MKLFQIGSLGEDPNQKANSSSNFTFLKQESPQHLKESMKSKSGEELQPTFNFTGSRHIEVKNSGIKTSENMIPPPDQHQSEETSSEDSLLSAGIQEHAEPKVKPVVLAPEAKDSQPDLKTSAFEPTKKPLVMQSPIIMIPKYQGPADMSAKFPKLAELFKAIESKKPELAFLSVPAENAVNSNTNHQPGITPPTSQVPGSNQKPQEPGSILEVSKSEQNPGKVETPAPANNSGHRAMSKETLAILQRLHNPTASLSPLGRWGMANSIQPAATLTSVMAQAGESNAAGGTNTEPPSTLLPDSAQMQPKGVVSQLALPKMHEPVAPDDKAKKVFEDVFGRISAKSINEVH